MSPVGIGSNQPFASDGVVTSVAPLMASSRLARHRALADRSHYFSFDPAISIGLRSGEYGAGNLTLAPISLMKGRRSGSTSYIHSTNTARSPWVRASAWSRATMVIFFPRAPPFAVPGPSWRC